MFSYKGTKIKVAVVKPPMIYNTETWPMKKLTLEKKLRRDYKYIDMIYMMRRVALQGGRWTGRWKVGGSEEGRKDDVRTT